MFLFPVKSPRTVVLHKAPVLWKAPISEGNCIYPHLLIQCHANFKLTKLLPQFQISVSIFNLVQIFWFILLFFLKRRGLTWLTHSLLEHLQANTISVTDKILFTSRFCLFYQWDTIYSSSFLSDLQSRHKPGFRTSISLRRVSFSFTNGILFTPLLSCLVYSLAQNWLQTFFYIGFSLSFINATYFQFTPIFYSKLQLDKIENNAERTPTQSVINSQIITTKSELPQSTPETP